MDTPINDEQITNAFEELSECRVELNRASLASRDARLTYEDSKARILSSTDPKELGSNEATRSARIDAMLTNELTALRACEVTEQNRRCAHDVAQIEVKRIETLITWMGFYKWTV